LSPLHMKSAHFLQNFFSHTISQHVRPWIHIILCVYMVCSEYNCYPKEKKSQRKTSSQLHFSEVTVGLSCDEIWHGHWLTNTGPVLGFSRICRSYRTSW
jgi:hypothetical protein